jgi:hypothetical protein
MERLIGPPSLTLALSTIGSSADGPPLPLRGKGKFTMLFVMVA